MQSPPLQTRGREQPPVANEAQLVADVLARDRKATAEFVERCADYVYPQVRRRMARTASVDDVMQEILLAAWQSLASFRGDVGLRAWVLGIARHKVDDHYRKLIREANIQEEEDSGTDVPATAAGPEKQLELAAEQDRVHRTLALLPDAYVAALLWRYRDERSTRDIAQDTGKTEKAIERLLARAREGFRKRWNDARA